MRLFVAVWPPPSVVAPLAAALAGAGAGVAAGATEHRVRWTPPPQWHVTLRFFGETGLDEALAGFRSVRHGPVDATVGPVTGSFGRRVLHVPVGGIDSLAAAVVAATASAGRPPDDRPFAGHLTLARGHGRGGADLSPWRGIPVAGSWPVDQLTLVASTTGPGGARYEIVDRLRLG